VKRKSKSKREGDKQGKGHVGHMRVQIKARLAARRASISELLLQGRNYRQIAQALKIRSTKTVHDDVQQILAEWQTEHKYNIDQWVALELGKVGRIEDHAWQSYERSLRDAETVSTETSLIKLRGGRGKHAFEVPAEQTKHSRSVKGQAGDPRFLEVALRCVARRCELLGLDAPVKIEHGGEVGVEDLEQIRKRRWEQAAPAFAAAARQSQSDEP